MVLAVRDNNECDFGIKFDDVSKLDLVRELAKEGLSAWYQSANEDEDFENDYFTEEEVEGFYWDGYAEPTSLLLDRYGIKHEIVELEYDDNDKLICDEVLYLW